MKKTIGLIVNPVAGMGGSIGLKGTDGKMYEKALALGAKPVTPIRTKDFLMHIGNKDKITLLVAPDKMGEAIVKEFDIPFRVIGTIDDQTSSEDTKRIAGEMLINGVELLVFVGGDGTARDIYDGIDSRVLVVAVPSGVKIFSAVFAVSARAAANMVDAFLDGTDATEEEVLDINEEAFREGRLSSKLYGYLTVPNVRDSLQRGKSASNTGKSSVESKKNIAEYIVTQMDSETLYLLGPGTTLKSLTDEMGIPKTLLGVDAVYQGKLVGEDLNERGILSLFEQYEKKTIVVTPIGGNGFIFGRGSKQFTPGVIKQVDRGNIIVVGTKDKVTKLECLRVDTGDFKLDEYLSGTMEVIVGKNEAMVMEVKC